MPTLKTATETAIIKSVNNGEPTLAELFKSELRIIETDDEKGYKEVTDGGTVVNRAKLTIGVYLTKIVDYMGFKEPEVYVRGKIAQFIIEHFPFLKASEIESAFDLVLTEDSEITLKYNRVLTLEVVSRVLNHFVRYKGRLLKRGRLNSLPPGERPERSPEQLKADEEDLRKLVIEIYRDFLLDPHKFEKRSFSFPLVYDALDRWELSGLTLYGKKEIYKQAKDAVRVTLATDRDGAGSTDLRRAAGSVLDRYNKGDTSEFDARIKAECKRISVREIFSIYRDAGFNLSEYIKGIEYG